MSCPESYSPRRDRAVPPQSASGQRFALLIAQHDRASESATAELRQAACEYVAELRAQSMPPERVLVQIKNLLRLSPGYDEDDRQQRHTLQQVITWCIEAYYDGDDRP